MQPGKLQEFPKELAEELCHCILAHHGELEFGSPKKPATMEALALHYADLADSKLETVREALLNVKPDEEWTAYNRFLDGRFKKMLYRVIQLLINTEYMGKFLVKCQSFPICFVIIPEPAFTSKESTGGMPGCKGVRN